MMSAQNTLMLTPAGVWCFINQRDENESGGLNTGESRGESLMFLHQFGDLQFIYKIK